MMHLLVPYDQILYRYAFLCTATFLLPQVRGVEALRAFSLNLLTPYVAPPPQLLGSDRERELEAEVAALRRRVAELEGAVKK